MLHRSAARAPPVAVHVRGFFDVERWGRREQPWDGVASAYARCAATLAAAEPPPALSARHKGLAGAAGAASTAPRFFVAADNQTIVELVKARLAPNGATLSLGEQHPGKTVVKVRHLSQ